MRAPVAKGDVALTRKSGCSLTGVQMLRFRPDPDAPDAASYYAHAETIELARTLAGDASELLMFETRSGGVGPGGLAAGSPG